MNLLSAGKKGLQANIAANGHILADRQELRSLFESIAGRLLAGAALELEDLVDALTLKDNRGASVADPVIALDRLVRDAVGLAPLLRTSAHDRHCPKAENRLPLFQCGAGYSYGTSESSVDSLAARLTSAGPMFRARQAEATRYRGRSCATPSLTRP